MSSNNSKSTAHDDNFRVTADAFDFFRKRDRVRTVDLKVASNARCIAWNCDGTILATGCENRSVYVGSLDAHYCRIRSNYIAYGNGQIDSLKFANQNPRMFATCSSEDKTVRIWDTSISKTHKKIESKDHKYSVCWSPNDDYIVYIGKSGNNSVVNAIDAKTQQVHFSATLKEELFEVIFHPNGEYLFLAADGGKLIVLEFPSMQRYRTFQAHPPLSECVNVRVSPDGQKLAVGGSDACCSIWNLQDMMCTKMIDRLDYPVRALSFSKCSNMLAMGSEDSGIDIGWIGGGANEKLTEIPVQSQVHDLSWNPKYYLLAYATAPSNDSRERDKYTVNLFGCPGESRRA